MAKRLHITALIAFTLLICSCTKEDNTQCPGDVRVYFSLLSAQSNPADVDRMHLYVFDANGLFLRDYRDPHIASFNSEYYIECAGLLPGSYRFVAWAGRDDSHYTTTPSAFAQGRTTYQEALLFLKHTGGLVSTHPHHIFHSEKLAVVTQEREQRINMPLAQLTNTINVRTEGFPSDDNAYLFNIVDNNCAYNFDRSFALHDGHLSDETFSYTTPCTKDDSKQLSATLRVLRLSGSRRIPQLQLYNKTQGKLLFPADEKAGDLIEMILKAYNPNFDTTHKYDIVLRFSEDDTTGLKVQVFINGWEVKEQGGDLIDG